MPGLALGRIFSPSGHSQDIHCLCRFLALVQSLLLRGAAPPDPQPHHHPHTKRALVSIYHSYSKRRKTPERPVVDLLSLSSTKVLQINICGSCTAKLRLILKGQQVPVHFQGYIPLRPFRPPSKTSRLFNHLVGSTEEILVPILAPLAQVTSPVGSFPAWALPTQTRYLA